MESVIVLATAHIDQVGHIRAVPGWKAAMHNDEIWLKGPLDNEKNQLLLHSLPMLRSYEVDEQHRLFPTGKLTPVALLKELEWQELPVFLPLTLPVSALPATLGDKVSVSLQRSINTQPAYAIQTNFDTWKEYVNTAPLVRLQQLEFAVSASQEVIIVGQPLPGLPGKSYWINGKLLIPAGYDFNPPIIGDLLNQRFRSDGQEFILFNEQGEQTAIAVACFKPADRATIRQIIF